MNDVFKVSFENLIKNKEIIDLIDKTIKKSGSMINIEVVNVYTKRKQQFENGLNFHNNNNEIDDDTFKLFLYIYKSIFEDLAKIINYDLEDKDFSSKYIINSYIT